MKVGKNIRNIRIQKNITQEELAEITGIEQSIISRYENGIIIPPIPKLEAISKALEVPISKLLELEETEIKKGSSIANSFS
ncbi:helix-turn-helix domain-containing protein [Clostridium kluyveri]|uniref:Predicted transcriptional regulator n=2 Tax=Clostridium kluyveri TaxID=1534 RepID=A5MYS2_CLOK5|nr:helix-turn-helix transcriptional regulator [Clostridium kluyveri]EDK34018.1 Predicted transcriptional regulator [Clostridium kluyveri DSM 555]